MIDETFDPSCRRAVEIIKLVVTLNPVGQLLSPLGTQLSRHLRGDHA